MREVRLIGPEGDQVGIVLTSEALAAAVAVVDEVAEGVDVGVGGGVADAPGVCAVVELGVISTAVVALGVCAVPVGDGGAVAGSSDPVAEGTGVARVEGSSRTAA